MSATRIKMERESLTKWKKRALEMEGMVNSLLELNARNCLLSDNRDQKSKEHINYLADLLNKKFRGIK